MCLVLCVHMLGREHEHPGVQSRCGLDGSVCLSETSMSVKGDGHIHTCVGQEGVGSVWSTHIRVQACGCGVLGRRWGRAVPGQGVPVPVNESIECQAVPPAGGEILDVYLRVTGIAEGRDRERGGREERGGAEKDGWTERKTEKGR